MWSAVSHPSIQHIKGNSQALHSSGCLKGNANPLSMAAIFTVPWRTILQSPLSYTEQTPQTHNNRQQTDIERHRQI
jgi:hypothetical protein